MITPSMWCRTGEGEWQAVQLAGDAFELCGNPVNPLPVATPPEPPAGVPEIHRVAVCDRDCWVLLLPRQPEVYVNGRQAIHVHVLQDRDSIWMPEQQAIYFTTDQRVRVLPYPEDLETTRCVRCKQPIEAHQLAVQCNSCQLYHHQDPALELDCWTFSDKCAGCDSPTDLAADNRWRPEAA